MLSYTLQINDKLSFICNIFFDIRRNCNSFVELIFVKIWEFIYKGELEYGRTKN